MADAAMRARAERLLGGDVRVDDLTRLFLFARDRCDGRETVQEIGDFVAHHDERNKGLITRHARDWYLTVRYVFVDGRRPDFSRMPANYLDVLKSSERRLDELVFQTKMGISKKKAHKLMPDLLAGFSRNADGTLAFTLAHRGILFELAKTLSTIVIMYPAFNADDLMRDLRETLKSNGIITKQEFVAFDRAAPLITLFAISQMHNCTVRIDDGTTCRLVAEAKKKGNSITVGSYVPLGAHGMPSSIFTSALDADEHCEPELLETPTPWEFALEVKATGLLGKLG